MPEVPNDELLMQNHEYDGIQELDNDMPPWWLWLFYLSIIFGVGYMAYYHILGTGLSQSEEYAQAMSAHRQQVESATGGADPYAIGDITPEQLEAGKVVYMANCVACHAPDGGGLIGPNFTDDYWIHGCSPEQIIKIIREGVLAKGMIAWEGQLRPTQIVAVTQFIRSLHGTTPAAPKAPEGTECK